MKIKESLIVLLPASMTNIIRKVRQRFFYSFCYGYDKKKFLNYSATLNCSSEEQLLGRILATTHVIEKGLTMPDLRLGFGKERVEDLVNLINKYKYNNYKKNEIYIHAIEVLLEYLQLHEENNVALEKKIITEIQSIRENNIESSTQALINNTSYFKDVEKDFYTFSNSRHSVRNLKAGIDLDQIKKAIDLAANVPTACNRQPQRIHLLSDRRLIEKILSIQDGRGFGHLCDKLIFVTVDLSTYKGIQERNYPFVDGGIYLMNLLYALHYYKVGACTLNWCYTPETDIELRKILPIKKSEVGIAFIMCGKVPEQDVKITLSVKNTPIIYYNE